MAEPAIPERFEARFFANDSIFETGDLLVAEAEFLRDRWKQHMELNPGMGRKEPEIV